MSFPASASATDAHPSAVAFMFTSLQERSSVQPLRNSRVVLDCSILKLATRLLPVQSFDFNAG
ncbi:MAG: hypothetical protein DWI00_07410 [Planctomycetota bacterium]|nr:MAG: hypothetical protein DWI00_07410 [Planctomycetota bacterium]